MARGEEVRRIVVDGRNLQGVLARATRGGTLPTSVLIAQLRAAVPPDAGLELVLDGYPTGGLVGHVGPRFEVAYARERSADQAIADRIERARSELGPIGIDTVLVVSDDHEVAGQARRLGARAAGTSWLADRIRGIPDQRGGGRSRGPATPSSRPRPGTTLGHGRAPRQPR